MNSSMNWKQSLKVKHVKERNADQRKQVLYTVYCVQSRVYCIAILQTYRIKRE